MARRKAPLLKQGARRIEPAERESRRAPTRESCTPKGSSDSLGEYFHIFAHFEPFSPIPFGSLLRLWRGLGGFVLVHFPGGVSGTRCWCILASILVNFGYFLESLEGSWGAPGRGLRNFYEILSFWSPFGLPQGLPGPPFWFCFS